MSLVVTHHPSPNFNARKGPVTTLVLHYTGMKTGEAAIERLCDAAAGVSAHYVVNEDGTILQLVAETQRAWHAGAGQWRGEADMNSASIGVEIVNGGHDFGLPAYPHAQIDAVIALCQDIIGRHAIAPTHVIGHSDMAPDRKADPGEHFPWAKLAEEDIGLWPREDAPLADAADPVSTLREMGYDVDGIELDAVLAAFQRRFRPTQVDGRLDTQTQTRLSQVLHACRDHR